MAQKVTMMMMMMIMVLTLSLGGKGQTDVDTFMSLLKGVCKCNEEMIAGLPSSLQTCVNVITMLAMEAENASPPIAHAICALIRLISQTLPVPIPDDAPILGFCAASPQPLPNLPGGLG